MPPIRVLLIDDDPDDQLLTRGLLDDIDPAGYQFEAVATYEAGIAAIARKAHDVYLLDYRLGERDGLQLLTEALQTGCAAPLILLTGPGDRQVDEAAIHAGAADYLVKGQISPALLERVVRHALDRKRIEEERATLIRERSARAAAEAAVRARDEFLAVAAHELKTPIANLRAHTSLLLRDRGSAARHDPARFERGLETIHQQTGQLTRLVGQLFDLSLLDGGRLRLELETTDIAALLREVIVDAQVRTRRDTLSFEGPEEVVTRADPLRIRQVFSNLLDNAIRYGPATVRVESAICLMDRDTVQISVRDHGRGIPLEQRAHLFERFCQHESGDHVGGLGLGLFLSRQLVMLHGGTLRAEFPATGGSCFVVVLPHVEGSLTGH
jgi:signal transduction histidine kinase